MIYYRLALRGSQSPIWRWKSSVLTSLETVLGLLKIYRSVPKERIRVFLSSSVEEMDEMLRRANEGSHSTAVTVDQLWDKQRMNPLEMRRMEVELGSAGDHNSPYTFTLPTCSHEILAWMELLARVERGELEL